MLLCLPVHLKRKALDDFEYKRREPVIGLARLAHDGAYRRHIVILYSPADGLGCSGGTLGGGSGGCVPRMFSRTHLPRSTGEVLSEFEVTRWTLPFPSSPRRTSKSPSSFTRRNWVP